VLDGFRKQFLPDGQKIVQFVDFRFRSEKQKIDRFDFLDLHIVSIFMLIKGASMTTLCQQSLLWSEIFRFLLQCSRFATKTLSLKEAQRNTH
jgi:hypothetical protein